MPSATKQSIAIITPVLNEAGVLPVWLPAVGKLGADELVVVDGGSGDATPALLQAAGVQWIGSERGRARQMNAGAARCHADILLFLHADSQIDAGGLSAVYEAMRDPDVAGGRFDLRLAGDARGLGLIAFFINLRSRLTRISTGDQAMFVRRELFERMHGFPELPLMEDVEFSRRLKRQGRIACLRHRVTTSGRRWQSRGVGRTVLLMWWLRLLYWCGVSPARLAARYRDAR